MRFSIKRLFKEKKNYLNFIFSRKIKDLNSILTTCNSKEFINTRKVKKQKRTQSLDSQTIEETDELSLSCSEELYEISGKKFSLVYGAENLQSAKAKKIGIPILFLENDLGAHDATTKSRTQKFI